MSPDTVIFVKIGGKKYTLPVNPEEIEVSHPHADKTADVAGLGEILIPQKPGLTCRRPAHRQGRRRADASFS